MKICIHRGCNQIGGSCVEIEQNGYRILVDIGLPLDANASTTDLLPPVKGLQVISDDLLGIIISHPHQDHYGLLSCVPEYIPIAMGAAGRRILNKANSFIPTPTKNLGTLELKDRCSFDIGVFRITPYLVDHSAYDSYSLLIEAGGKRIFYTGDFRAHGRKSKLFEKLVANPPKSVDCLLLEGTCFTRLGEDEHFVTEDNLESLFVDSFKRISGLPIVFASGQNIDRLVTIYRAAIKSGRKLIIDLYTSEILAATENENLPQGHWNAVHVIIPFSQSRQANETDNLYKRHNCITWKKLHELAPQAVLLCRPSILKQLARHGNLTGAEAIYSMWEGYLADGKLEAELQSLGILKTHIHTSGHADIPTLKRLVKALNPSVVVPIHSAYPEKYKDVFPNVIRHGDGEWWEV